jgi:DMSO/TMAO reductase YedYZ molybdopterin-dependent catalytic subunit
MWVVERPAAFSLDEIRDLPKVEIEAFIKCAGFPYDHTIATRNVSNAVWGGTRLADVLHKVGTHVQASFV